MSKKNNESKFKGKKLKAIKLLAEGDKTYQEIAEEIPCSVSTLDAWRKDPLFIDEVVVQSREWLCRCLPTVYRRMKDLASGGNLGYTRLLLEHLERIEELQSNARQGSITFTWKEKD